jgi:hypothetical protein
LARAVERVVFEGAPAAPVEHLVRLARRLGAGVDVAAPQELLYEALTDPAVLASGPTDELRAAGTALGLAVDRLFRVGRPVPG